MMNQFPPSRVLESLHSNDIASSNSQSHEFLSSDQCFQSWMEKLDSMDDVFDKVFANYQLQESPSFDKVVDVDGVGGNFNLETNLDTLGSTTIDFKKIFEELEAVKQDTSGGVSSLQSSQVYYPKTESVDINSSRLESDVAENVFTHSMDVEGSTTFSPRLTSYFQDFQEPFHELVYPKGDPDAVTLSKRDVDQLQPNTYINDTIIDFYILYLKNKIQEKERARFHFFNSCFFRKLADMDKNPHPACDGKSAFQRVCKWTRKVNLFEKDFVFMPVNFKHHWSLIVICNPGEAVNIIDKEPEKSLRLPCMLHMDSIKGHHNGLKDLVQSYLSEEWKDRKKDTYGEDLSSRFLNMPFLPVEIPQQENSFDCGLFLLHYLELFVAQVPFDFNPFTPTKLSNFLNVDWFPPADAYLKRTRIHKLIFELVENHGSHEGFSPDDGDNQHCSEYIDNSSIGGQCHLFNGEASTSHPGQRIEMFPSYNTSNMVLKQHFEPGAASGTSLRHCQSFDQRSLSSSNHLFNRIGGQSHLFNGEASTSHSGQGIEMFPSYNTSNMVLKQHFEPGAASRTSLRHCQSFDQQSLSSSNYLFDRIGGQRHLFNREASTSHSGQGIEMFPSYNTTNMVLKQHFEPGAASGTSLRHCQSFDQRSLSSSNHLFNRIGGQSHLFNEEASTSHPGQGIEMFPSYNTSNMVLKQHFEPGAASGTSLRHCQSFDQRSLSSSNHLFNRIGGQSHLFNEEALTSHPGQGIEMFPSYNTSNMVLKQHFEPGAASGTSLRHCQSFDQRSLSSSNHLFNRIGGQSHLFNEEASTSHSGQGIEMFPSYNTSNMVLKEHFELGATLGTSLRYCQSFDQRSLSSSNHLFNSSIYTMERPRKKRRLMPPWMEVMES
ncbi:Ulp1 protease family, carboxy-terminal domain protein [Medicago truncatula]|uniref:Ulp1 protease family, carboxy-terminal domain protein n=1 Tax=Medicago truncatula TaxID=3880 RepID=G7KBL6_MEDTR|nr:Ulp1 protease family, carboxy-terminal domain protein [Medicago truncatula]